MVLSGDLQRFAEVCRGQDGLGGEPPPRELVAVRAPAEGGRRVHVVPRHPRLLQGRPAAMEPALPGSLLPSLPGSST